MTSVSLCALSHGPSEGEKLHCYFLHAKGLSLQAWKWRFGSNADPPPGFPVSWATHFSSLRSGVTCPLLLTFPGNAGPVLLSWALEALPFLPHPRSHHDNVVCRATLSQQPTGESSQDTRGAVLRPFWLPLQASLHHRPARALPSLLWLTACVQAFQKPKGENFQFSGHKFRHSHCDSPERGKVRAEASCQFQFL